MDPASDGVPRPVIPVQVLPAAAPVLSYEKPFLYRYKSNLPPPGVVAKTFWRACFAAGRLFGKLYRPRPEPRLYTPPRGSAT
jgi:hypothetical protein